MPFSLPPRKEMGGLYFSVNVVLSQAGCWVAAALYSSHYLGTAKGDDGSVYSTKIPDATIYAALGALLGTWLLSVFLFFSKIKRKYWSTFYSTKTGSQESMSYFLDHDDDETKAYVFTSHEDLWKKIDREVKEWTLANWRRWEKDKPAWFTEHFKESVPDHMIPKMSLEEMNKRAGGKRRRSSAFTGMTSVQQTQKSGE
jgi:hypothetical protein